MKAVTVLPVVFQCRLQKLQFLQWHPSVGQFQLSFSSGVPVCPANIHWVAQWYPSLRWVNQWHSSGIPVYTGAASVHWLRVRVYSGCVWLFTFLVSQLFKDTEFYGMYQSALENFFTDMCHGRRIWISFDWQILPHGRSDEEKLNRPCEAEGTCF